MNVNFNNCQFNYSLASLKGRFLQLTPLQNKVIAIAVVAFGLLAACLSIANVFCEIATLFFKSKASSVVTGVTARPRTNKNNLLDFLKKNGKKIIKLDCRNLSLSTSDVDEVVASCPKLEQLYLQGASLSNNHLARLKGLTSLKFLNLKDGKHLSYAGLAHLNSLGRLESLSLHDCDQLNDEDLQTLSGVTSLKDLDIGGCTNITDAALNFLEPLTFLENLNLKGCDKITDRGIASLKAFPSLKHLILDDCKSMTDTALMELQTHIGLEHLSLRNCAQITDKGLQYLGALTSLKYLSIEECHQVGDQGLLYLNSLHSLEILHLGSSSVTDKGLSLLKSHGSLFELDLSKCGSITDSGLKELDDLVNLEDLGLNFCDKLTDSGIAHLHHLVSLKNLSLRGCNIDGSCLDDLWKKMPFSLVGLNLSECSNITDDSLSSYVKLMTSLERLYLRENTQLTDKGIQELSHLRHLKSLDLKGTKITGACFESLNVLTSLEWLNLSRCTFLNDVALVHLRPLASSLKILLLPIFAQIRNNHRITQTGLSDFRTRFKGEIIPTF